MSTPIIIIMGVSGCGKSTIGLQLSTATGLPFFDADDFHPPANVAKMASGQPLNDQDRAPWLQILAGLLGEAAQTSGAILACSALKAKYRRALEEKLEHPPLWIYLEGSKALIAARVQARTGHFMPPALLDSQFEALEEPTEAVKVSIDQDVTAIIQSIENLIK